MKNIDIENWNRKKHYNFFKTLDYPQYNICANVDISNYYKYIKEKNIPFFISMIYITTAVANDIKEFRYRMRGDEVVEHDIVHPSFTIMTEDEVFSFCNGKYHKDFNTFLESTKLCIEKTKKEANLDDEEGVDNIIYMTSLPWISFTGVTHPIHMHPVDSIPRIAWGKYFMDGDKVMMPLSIQVHHAMMDGFHVGKYFTRLQDLLDNPEGIF